MVGEAEVWAALARVSDPQLPVLSVVDLGIVDKVEVRAGRCRVEYTPTVTSCPATRQIARDMQDAVTALGLEAEVVRSYGPPWTFERLSPAACEKFRSVGIGVPARRDGTGQRRHLPLLDAADAPCPFCRSPDTTLDNTFGGSCCRELRYCRACKQPFQYFRPR